VQVDNPYISNLSLINHPLHSLVFYILLPFISLSPYSDARFGGINDPKRENTPKEKESTTSISEEARRENVVKSVRKSTPKGGENIHVVFNGTWKNIRRQTIYKHKSTTSIHIISVYMCLCVFI
jgi:hypothetical protein